MCAAIIQLLPAVPPPPFAFKYFRLVVVRHMTNRRQHLGLWLLAASKRLMQRQRHHQHGPVSGKKEGGQDLGCRRSVVNHDVRRMVVNHDVRHHLRQIAEKENEFSAFQVFLVYNLRIPLRVLPERYMLLSKSQIDRQKTR